ncbi:MAG: hypothetical protein ACRC3H_13225 [Lachnospiraceae bacterium]
MNQDDRDRCRNYYVQHKEQIKAKRLELYQNDIENKRAYFRLRAAEHYDTERNTKMCRKWYMSNREHRREYDRQRYLERKKRLIVAVMQENANQSVC